MRRRRREIGIRLAIGAEPGRIGRAVVGSALGVTAIGTVAGLVIAAGAGRLVESLLYGVRPVDPTSMIAATLMVFLGSLTASWLPARRALQVDPVEVLKEE